MDTKKCPPDHLCLSVLSPTTLLSHFSHSAPDDQAAGTGMCDLFSCQPDQRRFIESRQQSDAFYRPTKRFGKHPQSLIRCQGRQRSEAVFRPIPPLFTGNTCPNPQRQKNQPLVPDKDQKSGPKVLCKEIECALPCLRGRCGVVTRPVVTIEPVIRTINMHINTWVRSPHLVDVT